MSYSNGSRTITDGLVMAFDAANIKCFKGEPTVNLEANPINFSLWTSGATTTVTTNAGYSPDNKLNATRVVTTGFWGSIISSPSNSTTYTWSIYLRSNTGANQTIQCFFEDNGDYAGTFVAVNFTVTPEWGRFSITAISAAATSIPRFSIRNGDLLAWGIQLEQKSYMTAFVVGTRGTTVAAGGGAYDLSRNGNNGEIVNGPTYNSANGGSVVFDGSDDYIDCGTGASITSLTNTLTVEAWIKTASPNSRMTIYGNGYSGGGMMFGTSANTPGGLEVYYPGIYVAYSPASVLQANIWQHVAYTRRTSGTGTHSFYINGISQTVIETANGGDAFTTSGTNRYIGLRSGVMFNGNIASVRVYNIQLGSDEILRNYNALKGRFGIK